MLSFAFLFNMRNFRNVNFAFAEESSSQASDIEKELENSTNEVLDRLDLEELSEAFGWTQENTNLFGGKSLKQFILDVIGGEEEFDLNTFFNFIKEVLRMNVKNILSPILLIFVVGLLCTLFNSMRTNKMGGVGDVVYLVCFSIVVIIASVLISKLIISSKEAIERMQKQMNAIFPVLLILMTSMGGEISARAYTPIVAVLSNIISNIFCYVLLPLFSISLVLSILGHVSSNTKLGKLNNFIKSLFKWIIGSVFAIFMGYLSIKGFTAGASDGISVKATKYAIKNYIPMLGGYISEGFELVKAGSFIVKNAIGFVGILLLLATVLLPILAIAVSELSLKLLAGILEPVGENKTASLLESIAGSLKLLSVVVIGVALMYFLTIYLMTCSVANVI